MSVQSEIDRIKNNVEETYDAISDMGGTMPSTRNTANLASSVLSIPLPTVNDATLTIQKNGTNVATFTANASTNKTANITVPTKVSELTNDANYTTATGHTHSQYLTSTSEVRESYLTWGGRSLTNLTPNDMGCVDEFGHNKLAFLPANCISVEYTTDGGNTWVDYGASDSQKIAMVTTTGSNFFIGKNTATATSGTLTNENCSNYKVRVTISTRDSSGVQRVYTKARKLLLNVSTNGAGNCKCLVENKNIDNYNKGNDTWSTLGEYNVAGWSGWNSIPYPVIFGGSPTQTSQIAMVRLTFGIGSVNTAHQSCLSIIDIRMIGETNWSMPSELARAGHLYTIDTSKNATFPAQVTATNFNGKATSASSADSVAWSNVSGKPTFSTVATSGSYNDLSNKPTIPSAVTESTVSGWGFTKNTGTVTEIKMNGASKGTSGVVDLGTVITSHQDISGKQDKITSSNKLAYSLLSGTPTIPSKVSQLTNDSGFTSNTGTVTSVSVKVNGEVKGTVNSSGTIDLGEIGSKNKKLQLIDDIVYGTDEEEMSFWDIYDALDDGPASLYVRDYINDDEEFWTEYTFVEFENVESIHQFTFTRTLPDGVSTNKTCAVYIIYADGNDPDYTIELSETSTAPPLKAGENITIKNNVISAAGGGKWKLISDWTAPTTSTGYGTGTPTINADMNGKPFSYDHVMIIVETTKLPDSASGDTGSAYLDIANGSTTVSFGYFAGLQSKTNPHRTVFEAVVSPYTMPMCSYCSYDVVYPDWNKTYPVGWRGGTSANTISTIKSIRYRRQGPVPDGTRVVMFGRNDFE